MSRMVTGLLGRHRLLPHRPLCLRYSVLLGERTCPEQDGQVATGSPPYQNDLETAPGDLIEIGRKQQTNLGLIKPSAHHSTSRHAIFQNGREMHVFPHMVRFHIPQFIQARVTPSDPITDVSLIRLLKSFEAKSFSILSLNIPKFTDCLKSHLQDANQLWKPESFAREVFGPAPSYEQLHAAHRFLCFNSYYLVKPPYFGKNGPYFQRPATEVILLHQLEKLMAEDNPAGLAVIEAVRKKLLKLIEVSYRSLAKDGPHNDPTQEERGPFHPSPDVAYSGAFQDISSGLLPPSEVRFEGDELLFIEAMRHYGCTHAYNEHGNPYFKAVMLVTSGIVDHRSPAGLYAFMERTSLLPKDYNIHIYQSCLNTYFSPGIVKEAASTLDEIGLSKTATSTLLGLGRTQAPSIPSSTLAASRTSDGLDVSHRTDFTGHLAIAIDSPDTSEVDDAFGLEVTPNGQEWIHIHIADPTAHILYDSPLARLSSQKTSSIYTPETKFTMIPSQVAGQISLEPGRLNYALTHSVRLSSTGDLLDYKIHSSVLDSVIRLTYEQTDQLLDPSTPPTTAFPPQIRDTGVLEGVSSTLKRLNALARTHLGYRAAHGYVPLDMPSPNVILGEDKSTIKAIECESDSQSVSHLVVSELMVLAGRVAAVLAQERSLLIPYRIQARPKTLPSDTLSLSGATGDAYIRPSQDPDYLVKLVALFPHLPKSRMGLVPERHYTMGLDLYTRTSSPMRRFSDMIVHYQLKAALYREHYAALGTSLGRSLTQAELLPLLDHINDMEPKLKSVQRRSIRFWILTYLSRAPAQTPFTGIVVSIYPEEGLYQIYVRELYSSFQLRSVERPLSLGQSVLVTASHVDRQANIVRWSLVDPSPDPSRTSSSFTSFLNSQGPCDPTS